MGRSWIIFLLVSAARLLQGGEAVLQTRDGRILTGLVRMETDRVIVGNAEALTIIPVGVTNLLRLTFERPARATIDAETAGLKPGVPAPWNQVDIGSYFAVGQTLSGGSIFRLLSGGTHLGGSAQDSVQFVSQPMEGNCEIICRVLECAATTADAAAGLMIRGSLRPNAAAVFVGSRGQGAGAMVAWRETVGGASVIKMFPELTVPCWFRLKRDGETVTVFASRNGRRWRFLDQGTFSAPGCHVGLAGAGARPPGGPRLGMALHRATFDEVRVGTSLPLTSFLPRARLRSGSVVAGHMISIYDDVITFLGPVYKPPLKLGVIASLEFQWLHRGDVREVASGREGILLSTGEFVEGEFRGLVADRVRLSSVLFGLRNYDIQNQVRAVVLGRASPITTPFEIETWDGSVWRANEVEIGSNELRIREPILGVVRIPIYELYTLRPRPTG